MICKKKVKVESRNQFIRIFCNLSLVTAERLPFSIPSIYTDSFFTRTQDPFLLGHRLSHICPLSEYMNNGMEEKSSTLFASKTNLSNHGQVSMGVSEAHKKYERMGFSQSTSTSSTRTLMSCISSAYAEKNGIHVFVYVHTIYGFLQFVGEFRTFNVHIYLFWQTVNL